VGQLVSTTCPAPPGETAVSTFTYTFDSMRRRTGLNETHPSYGGQPIPWASGITYNAAGQMTSFTYGSGIV
jgi:hypothetical protein